jgi:hypothetical protein
MRKHARAKDRIPRALGGSPRTYLSLGWRHRLFAWPSRVTLTSLDYWRDLSS